MKERLLALLGGLKPEHVVAIAVAVTLAIFAFTYGGYAIDTASALAFVLWLVILVGIGFAVIPRSTLGTPALVGLGLIAGLTIFTAVSISWSDDAGLAKAYAGIRTLRLADGPDEVHNRAIARLELRKYAN